MAKKANPLLGLSGDWEEVAAPNANAVDSTDRPLSKPDRTARELDVLTGKYVKGTVKQGNPHGKAATLDHGTFVRMKKKGTLDNDVNAKTFVISGNKIIGSQG